MSSTARIVERNDAGWRPTLVLVPTAELERLLKLGARPADVGQTGEEPWHGLADPEGNEFCLLSGRLS
jgi:glyoxalase superfamily protein